MSVCFRVEPGAEMAAVPMEEALAWGRAAAGLLEGVSPPGDEMSVR
ncbi:MAG TPA: hypothetical protein VGP82_22520 [Ktedonobacterales bacterium]|jgi:hypothetical protein|nr:hypothetical protein [Ktedonobacterales bacterium]